MRHLIYCGIGLMAVILSLAIAVPKARAISASPASLTFTALQGGSNPPSQTVTFSKNNKHQSNWASSDSAAWISVTPTSGQLVESDQILVTVNISGLNAGVYTGTVQISVRKGGSLSIPVTLSITASSSSTTPTSSTSSSATTATLTWSPNTEADLAGFKLYMGNGSGVYGPPIILGNVTSYVVSNLTLGNTYYFAISAYDTNGNESSLSTEVSKSIY